VKRAARYISDENETTLNPKGIFMVDPMEKGLRCVSLFHRSKKISYLEMNEYLD
jgi:hypothetical protein